MLRPFPRQRPGVPPSAAELNRAAGEVERATRVTAAWPLDATQGHGGTAITFPGYDEWAAAPAKLPPACPQGYKSPVQFDRVTKVWLCAIDPPPPPGEPRCELWQTVTTLESYCAIPGGCSVAGIAEKTYGCTQCCSPPTLNFVAQAVRCAPGGLGNETYTFAASISVIPRDPFCGPWPPGSPTYDPCFVRYWSNVGDEVGESPLVVGDATLTPLCSKGPTPPPPKVCNDTPTVNAAWLVALRWACAERCKDGDNVVLDTGGVPSIAYFYLVAACEDGAGGYLPGDKYEVNLNPPTVDEGDPCDVSRWKADPGQFPMDLGAVTINMVTFS